MHGINHTRKYSAYETCVCQTARNPEMSSLDFNQRKCPQPATIARGFTDVVGSTACRDSCHWAVTVSCLVRVGCRVAIESENRRAGSVHFHRRGPGAGAGGKTERNLRIDLASPTGSIFSVAFARYSLGSARSRAHGPTANPKPWSRAASSRRFPRATRSRSRVASARSTSNVWLRNLCRGLYKKDD